MKDIKVVKNKQGFFNLYYKNYIIFLGHSYNTGIGFKIRQFKCFNNKYSTKIPLVVGLIKRNDENNIIGIAKIHRLMEYIHLVPLIKNITSILNTSHKQVIIKSTRRKKLTKINQKINSLRKQKDSLENKDW